MYIKKYKTFMDYTNSYQLILVLLLFVTYSENAAFKIFSLEFQTFSFKFLII